MEGMKGNSFDGTTWRGVAGFGHAAKIGASGRWSSSGTTFQAGKSMVSGGIEFRGRRPRRRMRQRCLLYCSRGRGGGGRWWAFMVPVTEEERGGGVVGRSLFVGGEVARFTGAQRARRPEGRAGRWRPTKGGHGCLLYPEVGDKRKMGLVGRNGWWAGMDEK
jgi:hypothetical protein